MNAPPFMGKRLEKDELADARLPCKTRVEGVGVAADLRPGRMTDYRWRNGQRRQSYRNRPKRVLHAAIIARLPGPSHRDPS
jgi:hypothetical protein